MSDIGEPIIRGPSESGAAGPAGAGTAQPAAEAIALMDQEIARLTREGYVIVHRTDWSAQLKRAKHFSLWWALFWFVVGVGAGLALYIGWYILVKRDRVVFLRITPEGKVMRSAS